MKNVIKNLSNHGQRHRRRLVFSLTELQEYLNRADRDKLREDIQSHGIPHANFGREILIRSESLREWVQPIAKIIREHAHLAVATCPAVVGVVAIGAANTTFGLALQVAGVAVGGLASAFKLLLVPFTALKAAVTGIMALPSLFGLLLNPVTLVTLGIAALGAWFITRTERGQKMVGALMAWFSQLKDAGTETFGAITDALSRSISFHYGVAANPQQRRARRWRLGQQTRKIR